MSFLCLFRYKSFICKLVIRSLQQKEIHSNHHCNPQKSQIFGEKRKKKQVRHEVYNVPLINGYQRSISNFKVCPFLEL